MSCCPPNSLPALKTDYEPIGQVVKAGDLEVYEVTRNSPAAIVLVHDIFGFVGNQSRIRGIADQVRSNLALQILLMSPFSSLKKLVTTSFSLTITMGRNGLQVSRKVLSGIL